MQVDSNNQANREQCWFCEETTSDAASAATVEMHLGGFVGKSRDYYVRDTTTVSVPRCQRCKSVHDRIEGHVAKGAVVGLLIGIAAAFLTLYIIGFDSVKDYWKPLLVEIAIFVMVGGIVAWVFGRAFIPKGVKDQRTREHYLEVRRKIQEGWKVGPKPPGL